MRIEHEELDQLAPLAQKDRDYFLSILYEQVKPYIKMEVKKRVSRALETGISIPSEDFESAYNLAFWNAVEGYNGKSKFIQRLNFFMRRREADVWRMYRVNLKDNVKYTKARLESLDRKIGDDGQTFADLIFSKIQTNRTDDDFINQICIQELIDNFKKQNKRYKKVIELIYLGFSNNEIARAFGENEYNWKIRKLVQRAKHAFKEFILANPY
ncbi:sigma-70 family RNA polymerase sigma factor [Desulfolucanica intricata]|uniref:sigma-70 family RNA polymerase sigma factor n=1 Tax=Desulfolucanica intricata TaxID=1285191 RepID=UPI000832FB1B|nr:sigma-70 family RNA polymerase sigma factor [Desulfolucanica intricata]